MLTLQVARSLPTTLQTTRGQVLRAGTASMRTTIKKAEGIARRSHNSLANWKSESGNLQRTITGYIAGEDPYRNEGAVRPPPAPFRKGNRLVKNQQWLNQHYTVDRNVSPPIQAVPDKVVGVLHHYMKYSGYLPGSGRRQQVKEIAVEAIERNADYLLQVLETEVLTRLKL